MSLGLELLESQFSRAAVLTPTHGLSVGSWRRLATLLNRLSLQFCNSVGGLCCLISPRGGGWGDKVRLRRPAKPACLDRECANGDSWLQSAVRH